MRSLQRLFGQGMVALKNKCDQIVRFAVVPPSILDRSRPSAHQPDNFDKSSLFPSKSLHHDRFSSHRGESISTAGVRRCEEGKPWQRDSFTFKYTDCILYCCPYRCTSKYVGMHGSSQERKVHNAHHNLYMPHGIGRGGRGLKSLAVTSEHGMSCSKARCV